MDGRHLVSAMRGFVAKSGNCELASTWVVLEKIASTNDQTNKELKLGLFMFIQRLCKSAYRIAYIHNKAATATNNIFQVLHQNFVVFLTILP